MSPITRQTSRWPHDDAMGRRQAAQLGRDCCLTVSRLVRRCQGCRLGGETSGCSLAKLTNIVLCRGQHIAVESLGPMSTAAYSFLAELRRKISVISGDDREGSNVF